MFQIYKKIIQNNHDSQTLNTENTVAIVRPTENQIQWQII